jgi:3-hydroxyacyl-CoA dehydrogenase
MYWADEVGLAKIRDAILRYRDSVGAEYWQPAALLDERVTEGRGFY